MTKKPRLKRDWEGRHVRLRRTLETKGGEIFELGEIMLVSRNYGGLQLSAVRQCPECKRRHRLYIRNVAERDVRLLPEDYDPEKQPAPIDALRAENERLRHACLQVRKWGVELASLQPAEREQRFVVLWQYINQTLRTAVLSAEQAARQNETKTIAELSAADRAAFYESLDAEWPDEEDHWADEGLEL